LPAGWVPAAEFAGRSANSDIADQGDMLYQFMKSTDPEGRATEDPVFMQSPGEGKDTLTYEIPVADLNGTAASVEATIYSQAFMPSWFWQRFSLANEAKQAGFNTPSTDRLFYLSSNLNLENSPMKNWKFKVASDSSNVE